MLCTPRVRTRARPWQHWPAHRPQDLLPASSRRQQKPEQAQAALQLLTEEATAARPGCPRFKPSAAANRDSCQSLPACTLRASDSLARSPPNLLGLSNQHVSHPEPHLTYCSEGEWHFQLAATEVQVPPRGAGAGLLARDW